jgi:hypothetical protein
MRVSSAVNPAETCEVVLASKPQITRDLDFSNELTTSVWIAEAAHNARMAHLF